AYQYDGKMDISDMPGSEVIKKGDWIVETPDGFRMAVDGKNKEEAIRDFKEAASDTGSSTGEFSESTQHSIDITPELKTQAEQGQPLFQKNDKGEILGFTDPTTGKIYLNGEKLNPNTPVHEAGHIWTNWAKENSPALHQRGLDLTENSRYIKKVKDNKFYQEEAAKLPKSEQENYYREEALASAIGDKGAQFVSESRKKSFADWAKQLWNNIGKALGFKDVTANEIQNMTLDEFSKRAATDILKGEPQKIKSEPPPEPPKEEIPIPESGEPKTPTAIRKEKQVEIEAVAKAYKEQKRKGWSESLKTGLEKISKSHPTK